MLGVNPFVYLPQYVGDGGLVDAFQEGNGESSSVQFLLENHVGTCSSLGDGSFGLVRWEFAFCQEIINWGHPGRGVPDGVDLDRSRRWFDARSCQRFLDDGFIPGKAINCGI